MSRTLEIHQELAAGLPPGLCYLNEDVNQVQNIMFE